MTGTMRNINYKIIAAKSEDFKIEDKLKVASEMDLKLEYLENSSEIPQEVGELITWLCKGDHDTYIQCENGIRIPAHKTALSKNDYCKPILGGKWQEKVFVNFNNPDEDSVHSVSSVLNFIYHLYREEMGLLDSIKPEKDIKGWCISWNDSHNDITGVVHSVVRGKTSTTIKVNDSDGKLIEKFHIWDERVYARQWLEGKMVPDPDRLRVCNFHRGRDMPKNVDAIGNGIYMADRYLAPQEEFEWYLTALKTVYSKPLSINEAIMLLTLSPWKNLRPKYREQLRRFVLGQLETENSARSIGTEIANSH